jgi:hypothetical protein
MEFTLFPACNDDYKTKYASPIINNINNIDAKINEMIARIQTIGKNARYALGKPEEVGTYYIAIDVAHETNNFFMAALNTPLTSLSGQTFGTSKSCMNKFCTFAYAHYMFDKTPQTAYNVTLDREQQQDFAEITQFFKTSLGYKKMIDIFKFNSGATKVDQILLQTFSIQNGSFNEDFAPMATFFNKLMPSYIQSLENTYQMLNSYVKSLLELPDEQLKLVIPDIVASTEIAPVVPDATKKVVVPVLATAAMVTPHAAAATSPTVKALATAAAATVALDEKGKKEEDDEKVVAVAATAAVNLQ